MPEISHDALGFIVAILGLAFGSGGIYAYLRLRSDIQKTLSEARKSDSEAKKADSEAEKTDAEAAEVIGKTWAALYDKLRCEIKDSDAQIKDLKVELEAQKKAREEQKVEFAAALEKLKAEFTAALEAQRKEYTEDLEKQKKETAVVTGIVAQLQRRANNMMAYIRKLVHQLEEHNIIPCEPDEPID